MAWKGNPTNRVPNIGNAKGEFSNKVVQESIAQSDKKIEVNRALQTRRDTDKQKDVTVTLEDIDTAIQRQIEKFQLTVDDNAQKIKVPTFYASPEKWKSIQIDGFMRDYQGKILLPAIVFSRTSSEKNRNMMLFNRYLKYTVVKKYDPKNRYTPFNVLMGQNVPINDVYGVIMPDHMIFTYHFIIWTEYQAQANKLVERLNFEAEDYWGDKRGFKFQVKIDSISHQIQLQNNQDRMVKSEFDMQLFGYLLPDVIDTFNGKEDTTLKWITPKKIVIGTETVVPSDFNMDVFTEENREKWRNQRYPNLASELIPPSAGIKDTSPSTPAKIPDPASVVPAPPVKFPIIPLIVKAPLGEFVVESIWHLPAPASSSDPGSEGWVSYDSDYYYLYTNGNWKRAPKLLVNDFSSVAGDLPWTSYDKDYIYIYGSLDRIPMSLFTLF